MKVLPFSQCQGILNVPAYFALHSPEWRIFMVQVPKWHQIVYDSIADLGEIEVYLGSKFQSCFIDDFGMSGSLLQYWKYVTQIWMPGNWYLARYLQYLFLQERCSKSLLAPCPALWFKSLPVQLLSETNRAEQHLHERNRFYLALYMTMFWNNVTCWSKIMNIRNNWP